MDSGEDAERDRGWSSDRWMEVSVSEVGKHPRPHHFTGGRMRQRQIQRES